MSERHTEQQEVVDPLLGYLMATVLTLIILVSWATAGIKNTVLPLALLGMAVYGGYRWVFPDEVKVSLR